MSSTRLEGTWVAVGDRLFTALGMDYARPRDARAALARACRAIQVLDVRYRRLKVMRFGRTWRITADRLTAEILREQGAELREARSAIRASLAA